MNKKEISEAMKFIGKRGGNKTKKKMGKDFYKKIIKKRWDAYYAKKKEETNLSTV
jgi:hypothetical protein